MTNTPHVNLVSWPISTLGGFIAPLFLLLAFWLLFSSRPAFKVAVLNQEGGR